MVLIMERGWEANSDIPTSRVASLIFTENREAETFLSLNFLEQSASSYMKVGWFAVR